MTGGGVKLGGSRGGDGAGSGAALHAQWRAPSLPPPHRLMSSRPTSWLLMRAGGLSATRKCSPRCCDGARGVVRCCGLLQGDPSTYIPAANAPPSMWQPPLPRGARTHLEAVRARREALAQRLLQQQLRARREEARVRAARRRARHELVVHLAVRQLRGWAFEMGLHGVSACGPPLWPAFCPQPLACTLTSPHPRPPAPRGST